MVTAQKRRKLAVLWSNRLPSHCFDFTVSSGNINFDNLEDKSTVDLPTDITNYENSNVDNICNVAKPSFLSANFENKLSDEVSKTLQVLEKINQKPNK